MSDFTSDRVRWEGSLVGRERVEVWVEYVEKVERDTHTERGRIWGIYFYYFYFDVADVGPTCHVNIGG